MAKQREVVVKDLGPISRLSFPMPTGGGVVVMRARNGAGKTSVLDGVSIALRQSGSLNRRRDAEGPAEVSVGGVTARTGSRTSHTGELEVCSIDDRLNLLDFIKPPVADPVAADGRRIKALLSLTGVEADFKLFEELLPAGMMTKYTQAATRRQTDIVAMAREAKKDLQEEARFAEADADQAAGAVAATKAALVGLNLKGESDDAVLRQKHLYAVAHKATLTAQAKSAADANKAREDAAARIEQAAAAYTGLSLADAKSAMAKAVDAANAKHATMEDLRKQFENAEKESKTADEVVRNSIETMNSAEAHEKAVVALKAAAAGDPVKGPTADDLANAEKAIANTADAINLGVRIRDAAAKSAKLEEYKNAAADHTAAAKQIREAAGRVEDVLSAAVKAPGLSIKEGRLWSDEHNDYFGNLSEGQRIKIALNITLPIVGEGGLLPLPQECFQDLDPTNRTMVNELAKKNRVTILTAEVADGDIRAELFEPADAKA